MTIKPPTLPYGLTHYLEQWLHFLESIDRAPTLNPGANDAQIAQAEEQWGFEFIPEVRELYEFANGTNRDSYPILPFHHLTQVDQISARHQDESATSESQVPEIAMGSPTDSLLVFQDVENESKTCVVCGDPGTGAVWTFNEDAYWEARSLTEFFAAVVEYSQRDVYIPEEGSVYHARWTRETQGWSGHRFLLDRPRYWRWEHIDGWSNG